MTVWVVTAAFENGTDVHIYDNEADAEAKYLRLAEDLDIHPGLGYVADAVGWDDRETDPEDLEDVSEVYEGDEQARIDKQEHEPGTLADEDEEYHRHHLSIGVLNGAPYCWRCKEERAARERVGL